jgi:hypothetical protein
VRKQTSPVSSDRQLVWLPALWVSLAYAIGIECAR